LECLKKTDKKDGEIHDKGRKVMERKKSSNNNPFLKA
jgi:hypothetical protein